MSHTANIAAATSGTAGFLVAGKMSLVDQYVLRIKAAMPGTYEEEELPLALVTRSTRPRPVSVELGEPEEIGSLRRDYRDGISRDRMSPKAAGALTGLLAGAAGLGVVHGLHAAAIGLRIARLATSWAIPPDASTPLAYLAVAVAGSAIGAVFASITKNLRRRWLALLVWALVFFVSLTMLVLAISSGYGRGMGVAMAPAILLASTAFALVWSFQLPLRRRS